MTERHLLANYRPVILGAAYLAALLAVDRHATYPQQLGLGVLTWLVLIVLLVVLFGGGGGYYWTRSHR